MRGPNQNFKKRASNSVEHGSSFFDLVRQSDHFLHQIGHIKESVSPYQSNTKILEGQKEKWFQYLPNQNANQHQYGSFSKENNRNDNYLHSLQRRLQKLFKEEKEMLKKRHYKNQSNFESKNRGSTAIYQIQEEKTLDGSNNIQIMDRKIRDLEQKYRKQAVNQKQVQPQRLPEGYVYYPNKAYHKDLSLERQEQKRKNKQACQYSPTYNHHLTQSVEQCLNRQKNLEEQIQNIKKSLKQLRSNNQQLIKRMVGKSQKKKHKYRTKQLLQNILHKLQFINVEIKSAKKKQSKQRIGKVSKIQKETGQILEQFELLRLQYKHLQAEKSKFQKRQQQIEKKFHLLSQKNTEYKS